MIFHKTVTLHRWAAIVLLSVLNILSRASKETLLGSGEFWVPDLFKRFTLPGVTGEELQDDSRPYSRRAFYALDLRRGSHGKDRVRLRQDSRGTDGGSGLAEVPQDKRGMGRGDSAVLWTATSLRGYHQRTAGVRH